VPESFEALLASLPSRFRTSIRSTRRKLAGANEVEFGLHDDPAEFGAALQALFDNHESRWRAKGQSGVFVKPQRREFYSILTRRLHERGALRFFYLKLDGRIVAQEYCFAHGRTVYLLQEGFDFALAQQNIGNALRSHVFEYLIEHRYAAYDFLAGVSRHKQNWSDSMPNDVTFTIARPTMKGRLAHYAPRLIERAKDGLRPLRDRIKGNRAGATGATAEAATQ
jgi:CelD/BcsL family acetyltransferase involved in cellulose biosynthesis